MFHLKRGVPVLVAATLAGVVVSIGMAMGDDKPAPKKWSKTAVVLQQGQSEASGQWELRLRESPYGDCVELSINDGEPNISCGFEIPEVNEIGFGGGLKSGKGNFFLYGLTSSRITSVVADSVDRSEVETVPLPQEADRPDLRFFIFVREPVENVDALIGYDKDGQQVQRVQLAKAED